MLDPHAIIDQLSSWSADNWSALGSLLTAGIAILAAIVASIQVREARRLRLEQAQPYVAVYIEPDPVSPAFVDLVVKNFGTTAAYDVEVSFDPPLRRSVGSSTEGEEVVVPTKFPTLVPNQEWRTFFDSGRDRIRTGLPRVYTVDVKLKERRGRKSSPLEFHYVLDLAPFECRMWTEVYGVHHAAKALREIQKNIKKWNENGGGLSVVARSGAAKDVARRRRLEEFRQTTAANAGDTAIEDPGDSLGEDAPGR